MVIVNDKVWFTLSEDSCKFFRHISMRGLMQILREAPVAAETVQAGCRAFVKRAKMRLLDLDTMQYLGDGEHITRTQSRRRTGKARIRS